jgi:hypothetical protein
VGSGWPGFGFLAAAGMRRRAVACVSGVREGTEDRGGREINSISS